MAKKTKAGVDLRAPNPTKRKLMGRSSGPLVYNEHVRHLVTPKIDKAIKNNLEKKNGREG
tara:strand:+ start:872 stop:1051 length:180 start_codon:yes stop_codon:yes gene_type:complete